MATITAFEGHSGEFCKGNCLIHPLVNDWIAEWNEALSYGTSWGTLGLRELEKLEASKSLDEKMKEANKRAAEDLLRQLSVEAFDMKTYAERRAINAHVGLKKTKAHEKVMRPCKWLYIDESVPKSQWAKNKEGVPCAPSVGHITGAQCWGHEYTDPVTKKLVIKHVCWNMHPNEEGWCKEWETNKNFKPSTANNRFDALKGRN